MITHICLSEMMINFIPGIWTSSWLDHLYTQFCGTLFRTKFIPSWFSFSLRIPVSCITEIIFHFSQKKSISQMRILYQFNWSKVCRHPLVKAKTIRRTFNRIQNIRIKLAAGTLEMSWFSRRCHSRNRHIYNINIYIHQHHLTMFYYDDDYELYSTNSSRDHNNNNHLSSVQCMCTPVPAHRVRFEYIDMYTS